MCAQIEEIGMWLFYVRLELCGVSGALMEAVAVQTHPYQVYLGSRVREAWGQGCYSCATN